MKNMKSIRDIYSETGVETLYKSGNYINPHLDRINHLLLSFKRDKIIENKTILDLSCGNGEVSEIFINDNEVSGSDPFTHSFYRDRLNLECFDYSFEDIAYKEIAFKKYDYIICSYALHLCSKEALNLLLYKLSNYTKDFIIISPSDVILERVNNKMNWNLIESKKYNRTHLFYLKC